MSENRFNNGDKKDDVDALADMLKPAVATHMSNLIKADHDRVMNAAHDFIGEERFLRSKERIECMQRLLLFFDASSGTFVCDGVRVSPDSKGGWIALSNASDPSQETPTPTSAVAVLVGDLERALGGRTKGHDAFLALVKELSAMQAEKN